MKHKRIRFRTGFHITIGSARSQAAEMVLEPGETQGGVDNHHRGADQWLYVLSGKGAAIINQKRVNLAERTLVLIERGETTKSATLEPHHCEHSTFMSRPLIGPMKALCRQANLEAGSSSSVLEQVCTQINLMISAYSAQFE